MLMMGAVCIYVCVRVCPLRIDMPVAGALCSNKMIGGFPALVSDKLNNRNEILNQPSWPPFFPPISCANYFY